MSKETSAPQIRIGVTDPFAVSRLPNRIARIDREVLDVATRSARRVPFSNVDVARATTFRRRQETWARVSQMRVTFVVSADFGYADLLPDA